MDITSEIITGEITLADTNIMGDFEISEPLENYASDQEISSNNEEGNNEEGSSVDDDNDSDDDNEENGHKSVITQGEHAIGKKSTKIDAANSKKHGKKRKRIESNKRRNIRKVLRVDQLDPRTLEAQKEEQDRLQRLELQRSLSIQKPNTSVCSDNLTTSKETADLTVTSDAILIEDDGEYDDYDDDDDDDDDSEDEDCDSQGNKIERVILISSSDSEADNELSDSDVEMDSTDEDVNLTALLHLKTENGKVLVNPNHLPEEPDIFLPVQVAKTIKPHQISGIRFMYDNLIESVKNFQTMRGFGCVLAHAMGLGKTIQTVALIHVFLNNTPAKKVLVLVPINTLQNWLNEFNMWVPENPDTNSSNATCSKNGSRNSSPTNSEVNKSNATFNKNSSHNPSHMNCEKNSASSSKSPCPNDSLVNQQVNNTDSNSSRGSYQEAISGIQQASNGSMKRCEVNDLGLSLGDSAPKANEIQTADNCIESGNSSVNPDINEMKEVGPFEAREVNHSDQRQDVSDDSKCQTVTDELYEKEPKDTEPKETINTNYKCSSDTNEETEYRDYKVFIVNDSLKSTIARSKVVGQWNKDGGVLLMGYEMFRMIAMYTPSLCNSVTNAKGKKRQKAKKSAAVIDIEEEEKEMQLFLSMQGALCSPGPDLVVCDEGHRIKNHQSNIHHALHKIKTRKRLVLTGYPLQNNLTEYWCMVDFVRPSYLGSRQEFQNMFERPIVNGQCVDSTASDKKLMKYRAHVLSSLLKGLVQRSDYTALRVALPPKQEHVIMVRMSTIQEAVYRKFLTVMQESYGDQLNPIRIFAVCSKMWNHPDILYKAMKADESKRVALFETDVDVVSEDGTKVKNSKGATKWVRNSPALTNDDIPMAFGGESKSLLLKVTDWAKEVFEEHNFKEGVIETSGKLIVLLEILNDSLSKGDKVLVFSQSLLTLDLIEDFLGRIPVVEHDPVSCSKEQQNRAWTKNIDYFRIDGSTTSSEREKLIDSFNRKDNKLAKLFMLSTRAGCLGINLIGANRVVVFDVSWNPCHDAQAVCRVYRYGQQKPCYIYRLVSSNTMEKRMYYRQISKQGVSDRVIDELNPVENFTKDELCKLLSNTWDEEPKKDYTEESKQITDDVLKNLCQKCAQWIVTLPFKHESLLEDQQSSKLTTKEKKEARRGYEEEKRKNSIFTARGPSSYMPRVPSQFHPALQLPTMNPFSTNNQGIFSQHFLGNSSSMGIPNNIALANILRQAEMLRNQSSTTQGTIASLQETANIQSRLISVFGGHAIAPRILPISSQGGNSSSIAFSSQPNASNAASRMGGTPTMSILGSTFAPVASVSAENTHDSRQGNLQSLLSLARSGLTLSASTGNLQQARHDITQAASVQSGVISSANFDSRLGTSTSNYSGSNASQNSARTCEVICIDSDDNEEAAVTTVVPESNAL